MITGRGIKNRAVANKDIDTDAPKNQFICEDFRGPFTQALQLGGAAVGTTGGTNVLTFGHNRIHQFVLGAGQTIFTPVFTANGLDIAGDQASGEGFEYHAGMEVRQETVFTIGTHGPFSVEAAFNVVDASGAALLGVGFRKLQAGQATWADYTDKAWIGASGTANPNTIKTVTALNNAADIETDTLLTWADNATKTLKVTVAGSGKVTYYVNGAKVENGVAYTFDATDQVAPFIRFAHGADLAGAVEWRSFKCGLDTE